MLNLYTVVYKKYGNEVTPLSIVATTPARALEGAKFVMRKSYNSDREILSVVKEQEIHRVVK